VVAAVDVRALFYDSGRRQLRLLTPGSDQPLADDILGFDVEWSGDPRAPRGPRPPPGEASCVVGADGNPALPDLDAGGRPWIVLAPSMLSDGPWCGSAPWRFDADLFRVRLIRVRVRVEPAGPGDAHGTAPETMSFEVAARNLWRL
jgi:hypothetical protein